MKYFYNILFYIKNKYELYKNFIDEYFIKYKKSFFLDNSLNYDLVPLDCRTNNFLENYNGFIKEKLGKYRIINWINFIDFIKKESVRSIEKLLENANNNKLYDKNFNKLNNDNNKQNYMIINKINSDLNKESNVITLYDKLKGMNNYQNNCYINASLQILFHNDLFIKKFFEKRDLIIKMDKSISYNLYLFIKDYANDKEKKSIDISNFLYVFGREHENFNGLSQQDAQEFIRILLEDINTDLNENKNKFIYKELIYKDKKSKVQCNNDYYLNYNKYENSIITNLFYSQLITINACRCKNVVYSFQKIIDIPLIIPENKDKLHIYDLLDLYFSQQVVVFEASCEICKNKNIRNIKNLKISYPADILIFSLQRIDILKNIKNNCIVEFNDNLDMKSYIDFDCTQKNTLYELYGFINHCGNINQGHYTAYVKLNSDTYYYFDDALAKEIKYESSIKNEAYILFYIIKNN